MNIHLVNFVIIMSLVKPLGVLIGGFNGKDGVTYG